MAKAAARRSRKDADIDTLFARAEDGDESALPALREALTPDQWQSVGNIALQARRALIEGLSGGNVLAREAVRSQIREMREDLTLETDGVLERLLVDRVLTDWLAVHHAEATRNQSLTGNIKELEFLDRRVSLCQRRYLSAVKCLAQVRRLMRPFVQVNIADKQQVNVSR